MVHKDYLQSARHDPFSRLRHYLCSYDNSNMCFYVFHRKIFFLRHPDKNYEGLTQVFACEYCENFKNSFFYRSLLVAASSYCRGKFVLLH